MKKDDKQFLQANLQAAKTALASQKSYIFFRTSPYFLQTRATTNFKENRYARSLM